MTETEYRDLLVHLVEGHRGRVEDFAGLSGSELRRRHDQRHENGAVHGAR